MVTIYKLELKLKDDSFHEVFYTNKKISKFKNGERYSIKYIDQDLFRNKLEVKYAGTFYVLESEILYAREEIIIELEINIEE